VYVSHIQMRLDKKEARSSFFSSCVTHVNEWQHQRGISCDFFNITTTLGEKNFCYMPPSLSWLIFARDTYKRMAVEACHETWVMSHIWMSHNMNEASTRFDYNRNDVTYLDVWHDSCTCVKSRIHLCDVTHSYVEQQFFKHSDDVTDSYAWHGWFTNAWHDLPKLETWLIYT